MNKTFSAALDELPVMLEFIRHEAQIVNFKEFEISKIILAAEEALVNVISYGYPDKSSGIIHINCSSDRDRGIDITIRDDGIPFNPLENFDSLHYIPDHNSEHTIDHRKIGGIGRLVIFHIMDNVSYQREGNFNILTLQKHL
ncbi:MAG: ATP-binding protein [Parachlamydiaceae bacterium]|nr:ATP-binding protein [Parachlamydiaceae bacterium]